MEEKFMFEESLKNLAPEERARRMREKEEENRQDQLLSIKHNQTKPANVSQW